MLLLNGLCGIRYNGQNYEVVRNAYGDVVMIMLDKIPIVRYYYDVWGNCQVQTYGNNDIGNINPFRWKGHYFDTESGLYYANGSYYDPAVGLHVDAAPISSVIENAFEIFGLDINGIMCDNILAYLPNAYTVFTTVELSENPLYDPDANKPWCELAWNTVKRWFASIVQAYNDWDIGWKIGVGIALFAIACIITVITTIATGGTGLAALIAVGKLTLQFIIGLASAVALSAAMAFANGESVPDALLSGLADGIFWGGVFAFVTAGVNAVKAIARSYRAYQDKLVKEYIQKYAFDANDANNIANSFEGKVRLKTSHGVKAHRYYDNIHAYEKGRYLTNKETLNPIRDLVLYDNQATKHIVLEIAKGQKYLVGKIAGSPVHAVQYFVGNAKWLLP